MTQHLFKFKEILIPAKISKYLNLLSIYKIHLLFIGLELTRLKLQLMLDL